MAANWWQECTDPRRMMTHLEVFQNVQRTKKGKRKVRLLACACIRCVWRLADRDEDRQALEVVERFADGLVSRQELAAALNTTEKAIERLWLLTDHKPVTPAGGTFRVVFGTFSATAPSAGESQAQCQLIRDVFGDPFRPLPPLAPAVLAWNEGRVRKVAAGIYEERAFERM